MLPAVWLPGSGITLWVNDAATSCGGHTITTATVAGEDAAFSAAYFVVPGCYA